MSARPKTISQRQEDLGPAGWFQPLALSPAANQIRLLAGFSFSGGLGVGIPNPGVGGDPQDQLTAGFSVVTAGLQRYDLVYLDATATAQIQQGTPVAAGTAAFQGAPGYTGTGTAGPVLLDNIVPIAWVLITQTASVTVGQDQITAITGFLRAQRDLDGFWIDKGLRGSAPSGASNIVTAMFAGESPTGNPVAPWAIGIVTTGAYNVVHLLDQNKKQIVMATDGALIYGRLTQAAGVWTLSYFTTVAGVETALTDIIAQNEAGSGLTNIQLVGVPKIFSRNDPLRPMFPATSAITSQVAGEAFGVVPLGGLIEWQPVTSPPVLPFGFEYADGTAVTTPNSPYLPANMPGFLKPIRMKTAAGGAQRFGRGADYSAGSHGAAHAEPVGGADAIPNASPGTDTQGGSTPFSGSFSGSSGSTSVAHSHGISGDGSHFHDHNHGTSGSLAEAGGAGVLTDTTPNHTHGGATGAMSGNDPHSHAVSGSFSGTINTAHSHTVNAHNHGGENRPAYQEVAVIMRVL